MRYKLFNLIGQLRQTLLVREDNPFLLTISKNQNYSAPRQGAQSNGKSAELDHDESPDSKRKSEPDGDSVDHDGEVGVE